MTNLSGFVSGLNHFTQALEAIEGTSRAFGSTVATLSSTVSQTKSAFSGDTYLASSTASAETAEFAPSSPETAPENTAETTPVTETSPAGPVTQVPPVSSDYPVGGYTSQTQDWRISMDQLSISRVSSLLGHAAGGGAVAYKFSGAVADQVREIFNATSPRSTVSPLSGLKGLALNAAKGSAVSALVSLGFSSISNGLGLVTGQISVNQAANQVIKDSIGGAVGGLTAVAAGGLGQLLLGSTGTLGVVASVAMGAVGGVLGGELAARWTQNLNVSSAS